MNRSLDKIGYIPRGIPYKESKSVEKKNKYFLGVHTQNVERKRLFRRGLYFHNLSSGQIFWTKLPHFTYRLYIKTKLLEYRSTSKKANRSTRRMGYTTQLFKVPFRAFAVSGPSRPEAGGRWVGTKQTHSARIH